MFPLSVGSITLDGNSQCMVLDDNTQTNMDVGGTKKVDANENVTYSVEKDGVFTCTFDLSEFCDVNDVGELVFKSGVSRTHDHAVTIYDQEWSVKPVQYEIEFDFEAWGLDKFKRDGAYDSSDIAAIGKNIVSAQMPYLEYST